MSVNHHFYSPITGLSFVNADSINSHELSTIEIYVQELDTDTLNNFKNSFIELQSTIIPDVTSTYNLGTTLLRFQDIYTETIDATTVAFTNLDVDGATTLDQTTIDTTDGDFKIWDGATSLIVVDTSSVTLSGTYIDVESIRVTGSNIGLSTDTDLLSLANDQLNVNGDVNLASGQRYEINDTSVLTNTTLGSSVVTSSLTTVGVLDSGSITSNFGSININSSTLDCGNITCNAINASSDISILKDTINSNRYYRAGTNVNNHYQFNYVTNGADTNLDYVLFRSISADAGANKGKLLIEIDDTDIAEFLDDSLNLKSGMVYKINDTEVLSNNTLSSAVVNSSLTSVLTLVIGVWNATAIADGYISSAATWNSKQSALTFGIADTNSVVIDQVGVADNDYAKFTSNG